MAIASDITSEDQRQMGLAQARNRSRKQSMIDDKPTISGGLPVHISILEAFLVLFVVGIADFLDYLIIGSIPIIGDIIDLAAWMFVGMWMLLRPVQKPFGAMYAGIIEFIPVIGDLPPTWVGIVVVSIIYNNMLSKKSAGQIQSTLNRLKKLKK